jgi:hypothetical protein
VITAASNPAQPAQPLAVPGLAGQVREHPGQVRTGIPDPAPLGGNAQQMLRRRQAGQLRIGQGRLTARPVIRDQPSAGSTRSSRWT